MFRGQVDALVLAGFDGCVCERCDAVERHNLFNAIGRLSHFGCNEYRGEQSREYWQPKVQSRLPRGFSRLVADVHDDRGIFGKGVHRS